MRSSFSARVDVLVCVCARTCAYVCTICVFVRLHVCVSFGAYMYVRYACVYRRVFVFFVRVCVGALCVCVFCV